MADEPGGSSRVFDSLDEALRGLSQPAPQLYAQLAPVVAEAASNDAAGKYKDASRYLTSAGARRAARRRARGALRLVAPQAPASSTPALSSSAWRSASFSTRCVGTAAPRSVRRADPVASPIAPDQVYLARRWDAASAPEVVSSFPQGASGCNGHLADACSWLAATEARVGKLAEAEAHHRAAFKAVEECGLLEQSHRALSLAQFFRASKQWEKHKALLAAWAQALLAAAVRCAGAQRVEGGEEGEAPPPPKEAGAPASGGGVTFLVSRGGGLECELDLLHCSVSMLHERVTAYITKGKGEKAASLTCGPLLALASRVEAFPLARPPRPGAAPTNPMPPLFAHQVCEMAAQLWQQRVGGPSGVGGVAHKAAATCLTLRVGFLALALGYGDEGEGDQPGSPRLERDMFPGDSPGLDARLLAVNDTWKRAAGAAAGGADSAGVAIWLPPKAAACVMARTELIAQRARAWLPQPDSIPVAAKFFGKSERPSGPGQEAAGALALALLPLANALMGSQDRQMSRAAAKYAAAGAQLCGVAGMVANQGEALHLQGAALFHGSNGERPLLQVSRTAFAAAVVAKSACGADGGPGLAGGRSVAEMLSGAPSGAAVGLVKNDQERMNAVGFVESLLFLAKLQFETGQLGEAESTHRRAMAAARERLGDNHPVATKAMQAALECARRTRALQQQGPSSPATPVASLD